MDNDKLHEEAMKKAFDKTDLAKLFEEFFKKDDKDKVFQSPKVPVNKTVTPPKPKFDYSDASMKKLFEEMFNPTSNPPPTGISNPLWSGVTLPAVGKMASAIGASNVIMNPTGGAGTGYVYAPYTPLYTSEDTSDIEKEMPGKTLISVPLWLGEVRTGGFHELVSAAYRNSLNPNLRNIVNGTLDAFSQKHLKERFVVRVVGNGPNFDEVVDLDCQFCSIYADNWPPATTAASEWTTPLRFRFGIPKERSVMNNRLVYGGHFYATGCADCENESDISKIEIHSIHWEDYRYKKGAMKIIDNV